MILRVLGACIVIAELAILLGASPAAWFTAAPAAASDAVAVAPAPGAADPIGRYVAPDSVCPDDAVTPPSDAEQVAQMACLLDSARTADGHRTLRRSPLLAASAAVKAEDIVRCADFSHTACGRSINAPFEQAGYVALRYSVELSENLAAGGPGDTPRSIMRAWLESAGHRRNLLNGRWMDGGLALRTLPAAGGAPSQAIWVSHFGRREAVAAEFSAPLSVLTARPSASGLLLAFVRPARAPSGRMTSFHFLVTSGAHRAVAGASIFFATRRARTNAKGQATIVARLPRPGRYRAVTLGGGRQATVSVQIVRRHPSDSRLIDGPPSLGSAVDSSRPTRSFSTPSLMRPLIVPSGESASCAITACVMSPK
jgi:uncharacterized protein YkwD